MNAIFPKLSRTAWLTACSALVLAAGGCGSDDKQQENTARIEAAAASKLAEQSEAIAELLDSNEICEAAQRADELFNEAQAEIADGSVPAELADELARNAQSLRDEVNCPDAEPPPDEDKDKDKDKEEDD